MKLKSRVIVVIIRFVAFAKRCTSTQRNTSSEIEVHESRGGVSFKFYRSVAILIVVHTIETVHFTKCAIRFIVTDINKTATFNRVTIESTYLSEMILRGFGVNGAA